MNKKAKVFRTLVCVFFGAVLITGFLPIYDWIFQTSPYGLIFSINDFTSYFSIGTSGSFSLLVGEIAYVLMYIVSLLGLIFLLTFKKRMKTAFLLGIIFSGSAAIEAAVMIYLFSNSIGGYLNLGASYPLALAFATAGIVLSAMGMVQVRYKTRMPDESTESEDAIANIICVSGEFIGAKFPIYGEDEIIIGRDPSISHIVLAGAPKVSRKHCSIKFNPQKGSFNVTDFSTNGTFTQEGVRLNKNMVTPFMRGSTISLGNDDVQFRLD